jgi:hypothetical protein
MLTLCGMVSAIALKAPAVIVRRIIPARRPAGRLGGRFVWGPGLGPPQWVRCPALRADSKTKRPTGRFCWPKLLIQLDFAAH